ncbi:MAG: nucleotidyltransferase domain-containing protein [Firmicutes bacterium]|nr:nucleotidyltransferase domain-containing protein [Bacillota bacterium]
MPGAEVIVFGSRARGEADPDSDWDVLVLVDEPATPALYDRIHRPLYGLGLANDMVISLIVQDRRAWESPAVRASPLYRNVRREGRWL